MGRQAGWACLAVCAATVPIASGLTGSRVFYIRDLSLYFWSRYLWLRRTLLSGHSPLWDPYVAGGQPAFEDALHQMFLLPTLAIRLIGSEVLGFNLWVALPFPSAALGAWFFFARRFSGAAAALGAVAFTVSGPVISTGSFPNMSWSVAGMPWVLWAVDRLLACPRPRSVAVLAGAVAFQALAGEPVTLFATLVLASAYTLVVGTAEIRTLRSRASHAAWVAAGLALGLALAAIQLLPLARAAALAERSEVITRNFWALHPVRVLGTISLHLFGNYYTSQSLREVPWMPAVNGGREPFFFSIYFGVPLLTVAMLGMGAGGARAWRIFWTGAGLTALIGAFGAHTPIYPFLRDNLPLLASFRFPVKYLVVVSLALAAGAAAGWDAVANRDEHLAEGSFRRARRVAIVFATAMTLLACIAVATCLYLTTPAAFQFFAFAQTLQVRDPVAAAAFMLRVLPPIGSTVCLLSLGAAVLLSVATASKSRSRAAAVALYAVIVGDLVVRAWGINPVFDPGFLARPEWMSRMSRGGWRFYVGGKIDGTLDPFDPDSSRAFFNPPGLSGSASRAALSNQAAFYPSAWRHREMLSYDLPILWRRIFDVTTKRFVAAGAQERDRFLTRTGVRYRILPPRRAVGHTPLERIPYFAESFLYDWGEKVAPRVAVLPDAKIVADVRQQIEALFKPGWHPRTTVLLERRPVAAGEPGPPGSPSARLALDTPTRVVVEASADAGGGYLVLLDSFSSGWRVTVDGRTAAIVRANGLFRAVRLVAGRHRVEFVYRPRVLIWGAALSAAACIATIALLTWRRKRGTTALDDPPASALRLPRGV